MWRPSPSFKASPRRGKYFGQKVGNYNTQLPAQHDHTHAKSAVSLLTVVGCAAVLTSPLTAQAKDTSNSTADAAAIGPGFVSAGSGRFPPDTRGGVEEDDVDLTHSSFDLVSGFIFCSFFVFAAFESFVQISDALFGCCAASLRHVVKTMDDRNISVRCRPLCHRHLLSCGQVGGRVYCGGQDRLMRERNLRR